MSYAELAIVVPAYNESRTIGQCLDSVVAATVEIGEPVQIIVVNDGSSDETESILNHFEEEHKFIEVTTHEVNLGKGSAIRTGISAVHAKYTVIQDADLEYDPRDIPKLLTRIRQGDVDIVFGSRCLPESQNPRRRHIYALGVSVLNCFVYIIFGLRISDEATCYKLFRTEHLRCMDLKCKRFEFCPEVTAKAARMGLRIAEIPVIYRPRSRSEGKKIRCADGLEAIWTLWRYRHWNPVL